MRAPWTWHGGGLEAARRHYGAGGDWLDLSTGINPQPWPGAAALCLDWSRLPEPEALSALESAAAAYFGVSPGNICAVPGTEIGLRLVGQLIDGAASHVVPAYRTHGEMIPGSVAIGLECLASAQDTLIVANPNNPDGRVVPPADLLAPRKGWLLVDEAFADCDPSISVAGSVSEARKLVVFRSVGKFFGLAGVRLGFVLGPGRILDSLRHTLGAWPLSAAALAIGTAAYRDSTWVAATRHGLRKQATALDAMLVRRGHRAIGACPLFRLIEVDDAADLFERLARRAILTRPFAEQPRWLRIGLPPDAAGLARLGEALDG